MRQTIPLMTETWSSPLAGRYCSQEMLGVWSSDNKWRTSRRLWTELARAQCNLGLPNVTEDMVAELEENIDSIDFERAAEHERERRHDVMAHIATYAEQCPKAGKIIHMGATSCFVGDNTDLVCIRDSLQLLEHSLLTLIALLKDFCLEYRSLPTLGFTHFQAAQLTTVGKRASLWLNDFVYDYRQLRQVREQLQFRGAKGTTGTQASFLQLFKGDHDKVQQLDAQITTAMGFSRRVMVCGQTYSRKQDHTVLAALSGVAQSAMKMGTDIRLLAHRKEIDEPMASTQVGSSAMAYKRNPMRCERMCGLSRWVMSCTSSAANTAANQWLERTLDDSSNRRLSLPEAFLGTDAVLLLARNVSNGLQVWDKVIEAKVQQELPFMATEAVLMDACEKGGDRDQLHDVIRVHSMEAAKRVKVEGAANDLLDRLQGDPAFSKVDFDACLNPKMYIGRAPEQVEEFIKSEVDPLLVGWTPPETKVQLKV